MIIICACRGVHDQPPETDHSRHPSASDRLLEPLLQDWVLLSNRPVADMVSEQHSVVTPRVQRLFNLEDGARPEVVRKVNGETVECPQGGVGFKSLANTFQL